MSQELTDKQITILDLNEDNFDETMINSPMLVIDFWASWCGPCKAFGPTFESVAAKYPDVQFAKVDIEAQKQLAEDFNVRSVPFVMVIRENVALYARPGALKESDLCDLIKDAKEVDMKEVHEKIQEHAHNHDHHDGHHEGCC